MLLEFKALSLRRGEHVVLDQAALCVEAPRLALMGRNGSGKSTLLQAICGLTTIDSGQILLNGQTIDRKAVAYVFQNPDHQLLMPTVEEDICFGLHQRGVDPKVAAHAASALLEKYSIESLAKLAVNELSEGQKHLVCLLSILILEPELIVFDEPFSSLDHVQSARMREHLSQLPMPYILASHRDEELLSCEQALWLSGPSTLRQGPSEQLLTDYLAADLP